MIIAFRSLPSAPIVPRPPRQPSHVPTWVITEARIVRALPPPREGMVRHAIGHAIAWSLTAGACLACLATIAAQ